MNPGDTWMSTLTLAALSAAQRRPEYEPRRHLRSGFDPYLAFHAQRRPEYEPRRHWEAPSRPSAIRGTLNEGRSMNPGDTCWRATRTTPTRRSLNEGRSMNPGDTCRAAP